MPKVTDEHKQRRREEILEGAQRAFARHGYEGATVARLEEETGLSRGAIFNYFASKEALFVALVARSSDRFVDIWLERGYRALLEAVAHEDADWLSVQIEAARRVRTDERFREQIDLLEQRTASQRPERHGRLREVVRADVPIGVASEFLGMLANGVAFARVTGDPMPDLDVLMTLVETGVAPR
ncbi:MAG: TetR/AcrR family transcriptional regulator [Actinomycetota bacterium]|nr:TetR/AcrR family transcriptional regulator [Actinomycetota bacterium]